MEFLMVIARALISLTTLFLITKLMGKKQVSELSLFDYVIGISIGNFAAEITINLDTPLIYGVIAVILFGFISYFISIITMKNISLRRFFVGVPTVVISNGEIIENSLKQLKIDMNDLLEQCRSNGYFDLKEIDFAIMEVNGKLSIMPKQQYKPVINKYLDVKDKKQSLNANIIIDGEIIENNLINMNKDEAWLNKVLKVRGYKVNDILLATLNSEDELNLYEKNDIKVKNILE